jgi:ABC-type polysaccharide/polyol phosphate export permease
VRPYYSASLKDVFGGLLEWRIWTRLGWQEVRRRYRRTVLGPFWATISIGMFVGGIAFVWAPLFNTDVTSYLPFLAAGLVTWAFITALINEGCATYVAGVGVITQMNFPYSILNFSVVWRNLIVFFHNALIIVLIALVLPIKVSASTLLVFPGLLIVALNGFWMTMLLGMVCARFRDVPQLVANIVQILMFVTPVFWFAHQLGGRGQMVITYNYMYHLIEVVRAPLLGEAASATSYAVTVIGGVVGCVIAFDVFSRFRIRIPYWL